MHGKLIMIQLPPYTFIKYDMICTKLKTGMVERQKRSEPALLEERKQERSSEDARPGNPSLAKMMCLNPTYSLGVIQY